jgi:hypothetical protein
MVIGLTVLLLALADYQLHMRCVWSCALLFGVYGLAGWCLGIVDIDWEWGCESMRGAGLEDMAIMWRLG